MTTPSRRSPSRRSLLAGAAGATGAVLLTGCSGNGGATGADSGIALDRRMRESAVRDSRQLLERYDATLAAHPGLAERLGPLREAVAAHTTALAPADPAAGKPSPRPGPPSPSPSGAAAPAAGAPAARKEPVPAQPGEALSALADAERDLSEARTITLAGAPGELARMLASVAACGAVHAYLLTSTPGAAS
ncbi:lipoprotein [Streptomyces lavendulae subsp. lavendulae]|nr:lipoprotein [Streptomyces lavendulae subsp. lavendulae]